MRRSLVPAILVLLLASGSAGSKDMPTLPRPIRTEQDCLRWRDALKRGQIVTRDIRKVAGRVLIPVAAKTGDYNPARLTVETDGRGRIRGASCD